MGSSFGKNINVSIFGQSHSASIGVVIDGLPAGHRIDMEKLAQFMSRRAPGRNEYSTNVPRATPPLYSPA
jgi:chorismate synthase (EC 4.2.3.5)